LAALRRASGEPLGVERASVRSLSPIVTESLQHGAQVLLAIRRLRVGV
jgi:hypothetical protein